MVALCCGVGLQLVVVCPQNAAQLQGRYATQAYALWRSGKTNLRMAYNLSTLKSKLTQRKRAESACPLDSR